MKTSGRVAIVAIVAILVPVILAISKPVADAGTANVSRPAGSASVMADQIWSEYQDFIGYPVQKPKVTVHTDPATFAAAAKKGVPWAPWAVGFYARGQVHVTPQATDRKNMVLLRHELAHALLGPRARVPRWFNEGFASYMENRTVTPGGVAAVSRAFSRTAITLLAFHPGQSSRPRDHYAGARLAVEYLVMTRGEEPLKILIRSLRAGEGFDAAFYIIYGFTPADLQNQLLKAGGQKPMA